MRSGVLFVNGESCGSAASVFITDTGEAKADRIVFDTSSGPVRLNGAVVFVQLFMQFPAVDGTPDEFTVRGTNNVDVVRVQSGTFAVAQIDDFPGANADALRLLVWIPQGQPRPRLNFELRGGDDVFWMGVDDGGHFNGRLSVKGGSGDDDITGGPFNDRLRGGSGNDVIRGAQGNDRIWGNSGNDEIRGGTGKDRAYGGRGADTLLMADGEFDRKVRGGKGADTCDCDANDNVRSARRL